MTEPITPTGEDLAEEAEEYPVEPDPKRWLALAVLAAAQLMIVLDASIVNIALPVGAGGPRHHRRQPAVDGHGLHAGLRQPAAAGRPDRRLHRPQAHLHHRPARLRRRLRARWHRQQPGAAVRRPRPAGRLRRPDGAGRAVDRHRDLHRAQGAGQGVRRLRCARRWRCGDRPDRRRRPHRVRVVALVPRRQRAGRAARRRAAPIPLVHESKAHGDTRYDIPGVLLATAGLFSLVYGFTEAAKAKNPDDPNDTSVLGWRRPDDHLPGGGGRPAGRVRLVGDAGPRTRCCRCGSCSTATAAGPTWSSCSSAPGCSRCSCS